MINLIEGKTSQNFSNKWRNIFAIFLLFTAGGSWFLYEVQESGFEFSGYILGEKLNNVVIQESSESLVGGDIAFEHEPIVVPVLDVSSTSFDLGSLGADCVLVKDSETGATLLNKNEYNTHPIASITKLMTALTLLEYKIDWNTTTTVIGPDSYGTHMYAGDVYTFEELWNSMLIASSNKAALSLVESINGTEEEFVVRMNERAGELGLSDKYFTDVTGIEETNVSTASDVLILLTEALRYPKIQETVIKKEYNLYSQEREKGHHMWNTDWLILDDPNPWIYNSFDKVVGGKTGHITVAGFNFTVKVEKDGHIIDIVVLGANNNEARFTEARDIGEWVFNNYTWITK